VVVLVVGVYLVPVLIVKKVLTFRLGITKDLAMRSDQPRRRRIEIGAQKYR
jgi:hypothetical protein